MRGAEIKSDNGMKIYEKQQSSIKFTKLSFFI